MSRSEAQDIRIAHMRFLAALMAHKAFALRRLHPRTRSFASDQRGQHVGVFGRFDRLRRNFWLRVVKTN